MSSKINKQENNDMQKNQMQISNNKSQQKNGEIQEKSKQLEPVNNNEQEKNNNKMNTKYPMKEIQEKRQDTQQIEYFLVDNSKIQSDNTLIDQSKQNQIDKVEIKSDEQYQEINDIIEKLQIFVSKENNFKIFVKIEEKYKIELKNKLPNLEKNINDLSQHHRDLNDIIQICNEIMSIIYKFFHLQEIQDYLKRLQKIYDMKILIPQQSLDQISHAFQNYYKQIQLELIKFAHQDVRKAEISDDQQNSRILVARKICEKGFGEKTVDFLVTFGNERFEEYYFYLIKRSDGTWFIEERMKWNEYNAAGVRSIEEFDIREQIIQQIWLHEQIFKFISLEVNGGSEIDKEILQQELENSIGKEKYKEIKSHAIQNIGQIGKQCIGAVLAKQLLSNTVKHTFKVVNNALIKQGVKGFMSIGGKKMLKLGADVVVTQAGKQITSGVVTEVSKQSVTIAAKSGISTAASFGIGLLVNAVVGTVKAAINSGWSKEQKYVCEIVSDGFSFTMLELETKK